MRSAVGRWPGGTKSGALLRTMMLISGNALSTVPTQRWVLSAMVNVGSLSEQQRACVSYGGFLYGAAQFDHRFFRIAPAEAGVLDPQ